MAVRSARLWLRACPWSLRASACRRAFIGGIGQGASLVVALALIAMRGRTAAETVRLSGFAQSIGYLIASLGPLLFGALYQLTGAYVVSLTVMTAIAVAQCVVAVLAGHDDA